MTSTGRVARLTALALATGTLVAAGSASAASTTTHTDNIQALGNGQVVHIRVALPAALPGVGQIIDQYISTTDGTVTTVNNLGATSTGKIGKGAVPIISELLSGTAASTLGGKEAAEVSLVDTELPELGLAVKALAAESKVAKPTQDGVISRSESIVAGVKLDALALPAVATAAAPAVDALETVVDTAQDNANAATTTVTGVLNGATKQLSDATKGATPAEVKAINETKDFLDDLLDEIQLQTSTLSSNPALVHVKELSSEQTITRAGRQVTSEVSNSLKEVSLLGGLVTVDALKSQAMATAGGAPGTAAVKHVPGVMTVKVADLLSLKIGDKIELAGTIGDALPPAVKGTVDTALAQVLGLLRSTLGLEFKPGTFVEDIAADGKSAATTVDAAQLILSPPALASLLPAGEKLLTVRMVSAQAAVGAQRVTLTKNTKSQDPISVSSIPKDLPRTGADLPLTGAAAAALIGLAMVARRRRMAQISE